MPHNSRIAIIGAGIAGLTVSALLKEKGFDITLFEKFYEPKPLGAGLVLQPTGLAVLANMGLDKEAIRLGKKLNHFEGTTVSGKKIFELAYQNLNSNYFSLGIHRHSIFHLLYEKVKSLSVPIITGFRAFEIKSENNGYTLISTEDKRYPDYDLIVDASGAHSTIRDRYADIQSTKDLAYGALWGVCKNSGQIRQDMLQQKVYRASLGIGLIPIGKKPGISNTDYVTVYFSIRNTDYKKWRDTPFEKWKKEVADFWPLTKDLVEQFESHDDLTWSVYNEVTLERFYKDKIVFIGDSAHSISPRLGQGANLGLVDALILFRSLSGEQNLRAALEQYDRERKNHVKYYHMTSSRLTWFFQSDSAISPIIRDLSFRLMCKFPFTHREMLKTLGGIKTGFFKTINPGSLHRDYDLDI